MSADPRAAEIEAAMERIAASMGWSVREVRAAFDRFAEALNAGVINKTKREET